MPATKPRIRPMRPEDMDGFAALCAHRPGLGPEGAARRAEIVEWIAFHNPDDDGGPTYFVVDCGGRIMGHLGRMPTRFYVEGKPHMAAYVHDLFVHPELQQGGRGLFLAMQLYRAVERACPSFSVLVWTNEINIRIQQARKYEQLWAERYVKLLRADGQIDRMADRLSERLSGRLSERLGDHLPPIDERVTTSLTALAKPIVTGLLQAGDEALSRAIGARRPLERFDRFDARFDRLAERLGPRMGIAPVKRQQYLRWKYSDRPHLDTVTYGAMSARGELAGYVVVCVPHSEYHDSYILELVADPHDTRTIATLCHRAIEHCRREGAYSVQCIGTDMRFVRVLRHLLFLPREPREPLFRANADRYPNPGALARLDAWHFSYGDSEGPV